MVDLVGVDHVGVGTDSRIVSEPAAPGRARGGRGGGTNTMWPDENTGFLYAISAEMLAQGFHAEEVSKIAGGNYCRIFNMVTRGHA
jgi:membrane dipeptidase